MAGVLQDRRHELFAQAMAAGKMSGAKAYEAAGFKATTLNAMMASASRLLSTAKVAARVKELQAQKAERTVSLAITDRNTRLLWLDQSAHKIRRAIEKQPLTKLDMAMFRELRATQEQAARELGQWDVTEQPQVPVALTEGTRQGFAGTLEMLMVKLSRFTVDQ